VGSNPRGRVSVFPLFVSSCATGPSLFKAVLRDVYKQESEIRQTNVLGCSSMWPHCDRDVPSNTDVQGLGPNVNEGT
jgi:hypothetical protein